MRNSLSKLTGIYINETTRLMWIKNDIIKGVLYRPHHLSRSIFGYLAHSIRQLALLNGIVDSSEGRPLKYDDISISFLRFTTTNVFNVDSATKLFTV